MTERCVVVIGITVGGIRQRGFFGLLLYLLLLTIFPPFAIGLVVIVGRREARLPLNAAAATGTRSQLPCRGTRGRT